MPTPLDHVLVVCITVLLPIHDLLFWYPRLLRAGPEQIHRARIHAYVQSIGVEWGLAAAMLALWLFMGRPWEDAGLGRPGGWGFWLGLAVTATILTVGTWQRISLTRDEDKEVRETVLHQLRNLRPLLPHTPQEMVSFSLVSLTAGICEELLFRGFLIWYLSSLIPTAPALVVGSILFGMAHAYQGTRGVIQTAAVGFGLVLLVVVSGSLWLSMIVHTFIDLNSGLLAYRFLRRDGKTAGAS